MASQHSCAYYSSEVIVEAENIRRYAKQNNSTAVDNHLSLLEKEFDKVALACGILEVASEKKLLGDMRSSLTNNQFDKVDMHAREFEKNLVKHLAKHANDGNDPLDIIPSRVLDSFG